MVSTAFALPNQHARFEPIMAVLNRLFPV